MQKRSIKMSIWVVGLKLFFCSLVWGVMQLLSWPSPQSCSGGGALHQIFGRGVQHAMKNGPNGILVLVKMGVKKI